MCKSGVGGLTCNTCLTGYYNLTERGCDKCGCGSVGSEGAECDAFGRCACRDGVRGDKCDGCDVGHSNLTTAGCRSVRDVLNLEMLLKIELHHQNIVLECVVDRASETRLR